MPGAEPMRTAIPITDVVTGLYAAIGVLGALHHRRETGEGQHVDAAMLDASVALNGHLARGFLMNGQVPARVGNTNPTRHRELALRLPHSRGVDVPSLRSPLRFSGTPVVHRASPMLGEHSAQVLAAELGLDAERLQTLRERAIV